MKKYNFVFAAYTIPLHWNNTSNWSPSFMVAKDFPSSLSQCCVWWCPGAWCRQDIIKHCIDLFWTEYSPAYINFFFSSSYLNYQATLDSAPHPCQPYKVMKTLKLRTSIATRCLCHTMAKDSVVRGFTTRDYQWLLKFSPLGHFHDAAGCLSILSPCAAHRRGRSTTVCDWLIGPWEIWMKFWDK